MSQTYTERQLAEKRYHDEKYRDLDDPGVQRRIDRASQRFWQIVGKPKGLSILDFGCGDGWLSVALAKQGNTVEGFDISEQLIERARRHAESQHVGNLATFREMAAENLDYPEASFDMVIGTSILHHTDLEPTLARIRHVLKPQGTAIFMEPLNQNPALRLWRLLTPGRRSDEERAFTRADVASVRRHFPATRFSYYCFTSMFATGLLLMAPGNRLIASVNQRLEDFDERLLKAVPSLGRFSAVAVMEMKK